MAGDDLALMAHLMRRAGFGATREELEAHLAMGYEATVEDLLHPENFDLADEYILGRYRPPAWAPGENYPDGHNWWMYHMINTKRPLEEKMTLFWHQLFATAVSKVGVYDEMVAQITMFRRHALASYRDMLIEVARNPQMIYWLDGQDNHKYAVNENWGRELLELFSMGAGNYTEEDVRDASRAFTGWSLGAKLPIYPYGRYIWSYQYKPEDHDDGEKTFLGQTGSFNGEDIIDIIVQHPATARFISRHLYSFFVADEPPVPTWSVTPPRDEETIQLLSRVFTESKYDIRAMLRALFHSDGFKNARFVRVKSPAELVAGTLRLVGGHNLPSPFMDKWCMQPKFMGQDILNPPSVEGWHTGDGWINSGSLVARVNFASGVMGDISLPGVQDIIERVRARGTLAPEEFVDYCLDIVGPLEVEAETRRELVEHASAGGPLRWGTEEEPNASPARVGEMLELIGGIKEYQYS